jgi:D-3-phosphoglycerate dehydrogenase
MSATVVASRSSLLDAAVLRAVFAPIDASVVVADTADPDALVAAATDADAIVVGVETAVTAGVLDRLSGLQVVGRAGTGVDNIDIDAATERDVTVVNVPEYGIEEVATHTLTLYLGALRSIHVYDERVRRGGWDWRHGRPISRLSGRTVGLLSFGNIAQQFRTLLSGFDVECVAYDPYVDADTMADHDVEKVDYDGLLDRADDLSIHAPLTDTTRGLVDAEALARLPDDAVVVNTGRGPVVDQTALYHALVAETIGGAGLDVLAEEPPTDRRLLTLENVLVTPHAAFYSEAAYEALNRTVATDVRRVLSGEPPENPIDPDAAWL